jgi:phospho-N-acetylmuramoyl-pentapeptide-transferase
MGGLIILAGAFPAMAYWGIVSGWSKTVPVFAVMIGFALVGLFDDFVLPRVIKGSRGFGWVPKLILQFGVAGVSLYTFRDSIMASSASAFIVGLFVILFFANAYNFCDGLDWLAGTVLVALGAGLTACSLYLGRGEWIFPMVAVLGGAVPFLYLNRPPAKIFMGDVGAMAIGGLIGLIFADLTQSGVTGSPNFLLLLGLAIVAFVMMVELIPVPLQILSVKIRKKRLFPMTPIHHAFQKAGWPETKIVGLFFAVQLVCSVLGFYVVAQAVR